MTLVAPGMLAVALEPSKERIGIPVIGERIVRRIERRDMAAFDRAEAALLLKAARYGDEIVTAYTFTRPARPPAPSTTLMSIASPIGMLALAAFGAAESTRTMSSRFFRGARIAALCEGAILVATPTLDDGIVERYPFDEIQSVGLCTYDGGTLEATVRTAAGTSYIDGLSKPRQFVEELQRLMGAARSRSERSEQAAAVSEAVEVAAVRSRLRSRGWMLAVANDYRLNGVWHAFWSFTHPDGLSCKGEGTSDLAALRLAEEDAMKKEAWIASLREQAA